MFFQNMRSVPSHLEWPQGLKTPPGILWYIYLESSD